MAELQQQYQDKLNQKEELKQKAEHTELMLDRAAKLVSGLAGERIRWEETVKVSWDIIVLSINIHLLNSLNFDGSFLMANSNLCLSPYKFVQ